MPDAFRTAVRIDDVKQLPFGNGLVRAFRFADVTIDTSVGDFQRHSAVRPCFTRTPTTLLFSTAQTLVQHLLYARMHEFADVPAERGDLPNQGGRNIGIAL